MKGKIRSETVQHHHESHLLCAQMFLVFSHLFQCRAGRIEKDVIHQFGFCQKKRIQFMRHGENDMVVRNIQNVLGLLSDPLFPFSLSTNRAAGIITGSIADFFVTTVRTCGDDIAGGWGPAVHSVNKHILLSVIIGKFVNPSNFIHNSRNDSLENRSIIVCISSHGMGS